MSKLHGYLQELATSRFALVFDKIYKGASIPMNPTIFQSSSLALIFTFQFTSNQLVCFANILCAGRIT